MSTTRVFFFDRATNTEIAHACTGWNYGGGSPDEVLVSRRTGEVQRGMFLVENRTITAADFPGVAVDVHVWHPEYRTVRPL